MVGETLEAHCSTLFNGEMRPMFPNAYFEKDNDAVCMTISDDGDGLSPDIVNPNSILEKGYTTTNGSGLGLYNVASFVNTVMHGSVSVENNQGKRGFKLRIKF